MGSHIRHRAVDGNVSKLKTISRFQRPGRKRTWQQLSARRTENEELANREWRRGPGGRSGLMRRHRPGPVKTNSICRADAAQEGQLRSLTYNAQESTGEGRGLMI